VSDAQISLWIGLAYALVLLGISTARNRKLFYEQIGFKKCRCLDQQWAAVAGRKTVALSGDLFQTPVVRQRSEPANDDGDQEHAQGNEDEDACGSIHLQHESDDKTADHPSKPAP
jgi:hypothetical protein